MIDQEIQDKVNSAINRGLSSLRHQAPMTLSEWADEYYYLSAESSSVEGRWATMPYQRGIMNAIGDDNIRVITLFKPARIGYTKIIAAAVGYFVNHKHRNQLIYQPTDTDARDFVSDEIGPMVRDVPVIRKYMIGNPDKRGAGNTKTRKEFYGSTLDVKGGKSARNYRRMTKDVVFYDELDGFDPDIEGEGSPISLGDIRVSTSSFPKSIRGSTPGTDGRSQIQSSIEDADMIMRRYIKCPDCGEPQYLQWDAFTWIGDDPETVRYGCKKCGSLISYDQYHDLDKSAYWATEDGIVFDGDRRFVDRLGNEVEPPYHLAFRFWSAYSYFITWPEIVAEFINANKAKARGDISKLKTFVNTRLGELWVDEGEIIYTSPLMSRRESYGPEIPDGGLVLTAGVDVQADRIEVEVVAWGYGMESWSMEYNVIMGDTAKIPDIKDKDNIWEKLDRYLLKDWMHTNGTPMKIVACCIDSGHSTQNVYRFTAKRHGRRVYAVKGMPGEGRKIAERARRSKKYNASFVPVGADTAKEMLYASLRLREPGPGFCHFPSHYDESYFEQLTAEKCVKKYVNGRIVRKWILKTGGSRNEAMDCRNYARAAYETLTLDIEKIKRTMSDRSAAAIARRKQNIEPEPIQPPEVIERVKRVRRRGTIHKGVTL